MIKKKRNSKLLSGALALLLALSSFGSGMIPAQAQERTAQEEQTVITKIEAEEADLSLALGSDMANEFVKETEPNSSEDAHIKTSKVGATLTLEFEGTGIRFYTKKGNGAGQISVSVDGGEAEIVDEYINSTQAQFQEMVFEKLDLSEENATHTIVLTTLAGDRTNFNFDYFEVIANAETTDPQPETESVIVEAEDAVLDPALGNDMNTSFVKESEPSSHAGAHIKTSKVGATLTLEFEGTGIRFYTKKGNGAGKISVTVDDQAPQEVDEYIDSATAQFQTQVFEQLDLSTENATHTIVLTTLA